MRRKSRRKPEWDSTVHDLKIYKLNQKELARKKRIMRSKHNILNNYPSLYQKHINTIHNNKKRKKKRKKRTLKRKKKEDLPFKMYYPTSHKKEEVKFEDMYPINNNNYQPPTKPKQFLQNEINPILKEEEEIRRLEEEYNKIQNQITILEEEKQENSSFKVKSVKKDLEEREVNGDSRSKASTSFVKSKNEEDENFQNEISTNKILELEEKLEEKDSQIHALQMEFKEYKLNNENLLNNLQKQIQKLMDFKDSQTQVMNKSRDSDFVVKRKSIKKSPKRKKVKVREKKNIEKRGQPKPQFFYDTRENFVDLDDMEKDVYEADEEPQPQPFDNTPQPQPIYIAPHSKTKIVGRKFRN